jgi:tRNA wybutosine-synthesizing protein 1
LTGRKRAYPLGLANVKDGLDKSLQEWATGLCTTIMDISTSGSLGEAVPGSGDAAESDEEDAEDEFPDGGRRKRQKTSRATDVEDMGGKGSALPAPLAILQVLQ